MGVLLAFILGEALAFFLAVLFCGMGDLDFDLALGLGEVVFFFLGVFSGDMVLVLLEFLVGVLGSSCYERWLGRCLCMALWTCCL